MRIRKINNIHWLEMKIQDSLILYQPLAKLTAFASNFRVANVTRQAFTSHSAWWESVYDFADRVSTARLEHVAWVHAVALDASQFAVAIWVLLATDWFNLHNWFWLTTKKVVIEHHLIHLITFFI